jgi:ElaB/YqjD/DUF883 family membrane-anchored ribosome-binding protein
MARNLESEFDTVREDLSKLRSDISSLTEAFQSTAKDRFSRQWSGAQDKFGKLSDKARTQSRETLEDLAEEIEGRPLTSVFIAFGVGILLGRLLDR